MALGVAGCGSDSDRPVPQSPAEPQAALVQLSGHERERIPEVLAELRAGAFSRSAMVRDNARIFLFLAETASDDEVVAGSLRALRSTWTHSPRYERQMALLTPEYGAVVRLRLHDERPVVQAAAIEAAEKTLLTDPPDERVAEELAALALAHPDPAGRLAALEVLWNVTTLRTHPESMRPYVDALSAQQPWLVSASLFRLSGFGAAYPDAANLRARLIELLGHDDPGVRGRAATTLSSVVGVADPARDAAGRAIEPLLRDEHPFVRSAAATALAWLDQRTAVPAIVALLDDSARDTYDLRGFTRLDGTPGFLHHDGSPWSRVDDAALRALQAFSARVGGRFTFDIQQDRLDESFASAHRTARAWFETARGALSTVPSAGR
ncbi:MAG: HEAT repeat domain-containing protein [Sandaracinaceae bacterium]|nr:HEAT repeat domain-containing protein [Sandaracinaceae bacterium]